MQNFVGRSVATKPVSRRQFVTHGPQADAPDSLVARFPDSQPLVLDSAR
jgi:hypothetical protein